MKKSDRVIISIVYSLLIVVIFFILYYRLAVTLAVGDYVIHNSFIDSFFKGEYKTMYPGYQFMVGIISMLFSIEKGYATGIVLSLCMLVSCWLTYYIFKNISGENNFSVKLLIMALIMNIVQPIFTSGIRPGYSSLNGYISPTLAANRPFAFAVLFITIKYMSDLCNKDNKSISFKMMLKLSVLLIISCLVKPMFAMAYVPAMGIVVLVETVKSNKLWKERIRKYIYNVIPFFICGLFLICQYLYYYYFSTLRHEQWSDGSIKIGFMVSWGMVVDSVPLSILFAYFFPFVLFIVCFLCKKNNFTKMEKAWGKVTLSYGIISLLYMSFLYQDNGIAIDCNFRNAWCFTFYMTFVLCTEILMRWISEERKAGIKILALSNIHIIISSVALFVHVIFGTALLLDKLVGLRRIMAFIGF